MSSLNRPKRPPRHAAIPFGIAADHRLRPSSVRLVAALLYGAKGAASCLTADEDLAAFCNASVATVERGFAELRDARYIRREETWTPSHPTWVRRVHLLWVTDPTLIPEPPEPHLGGDC